MKFLFKYILVLYLLAIGKELMYSQTQYSSYEGTHFFVGFMQNEIVVDPRYGGLHLKLFIFPSSTTNITVIFPNDSTVYFSNVSTSKNIELEVPVIFENYESEVVRKKSVEIISTNPILVYGFSTQYLTSDAYTAIPVEKWGKEYVIISYANDQYSTPSDTYLDPADSIYRATPRQSEFLILSAYDSTSITFYPRAITEKGVQVNYPKTIMLNKGQTYLVKSFPFTKGFGDLSGTFLRGDKPFGVIAGHVRTAIPQNLVPKWDSKNHLCEMLMPANSWGREFITVPFGTSPLGDLIKITSYFPNTTITSISSSGTQTYVLNNNFDVLEIPYVAEPVKWISDKPIQMAQFIMHSGSDWDSPNYDPAMTLIPPIEQFVNNVTFQTPGNITWNPGQYVAHFVNLIGTIEALNETYVNSSRIVDLTNDVFLFKLFNDTYFWANIKVPYGKYQIQAKKGKIAGVVYGVGLADAYALVLGSSLVNPYIGDSIPPELSYSVDCGNLQGYFFEPLKEPNTGISYVYVISDSTYNFVYFFENVTDTTTYVNFNGKVVDPYKNAKIVIEVRDRNGNSKRLSYFYEPPSISIPNELSFTQVKPFDTFQKPFLIQNKGSKVNILNIYLARNDQRFRWYVNRRIPFELLKNDTVFVWITLTPNGNVSDLYDTLIVVVDCNLTFRIPIKVEALQWSFKTIGYDFGKFYIGDTAVGQVGIVNLSDLTISFDSVAIGTYPNIYSLSKSSKFVVKKGDTAYFDVKFIPIERKEYPSYVVFYDELKVKPKAEINGIGVAPLVESINVDFGKVRLGKYKDTIVSLVNRGNIDAGINFNNFEKFETDFSGGFDLKNKRFLDSIPITIRFQPTVEGRRTQKAFYSIDWRLHPQVVIELVGEGVLPKIETYDVVFDTIFVNDFAIKDFTLLSSKGTDTLFIKEIKPFSGDINSFDLDNISLQNLHLAPGEDLTIPIIFHPSTIGKHEMLLMALSDATSADTFLISVINVKGFARSRDTLNANLLVNYSQPKFTCNYVNVNFFVENKGNISFPITGTKFEFSNFVVKNADTNLTGKELRPGEKVAGSFDLIPMSSGTAKVRIWIFYDANSDSVLTKEIEIEFSKMQQSVSLVTPKILKIGEKEEIVVSGEFQEQSQIPFDLNLVLKAGNPYQISFIETPIVVKFNDSRRSWTLPTQYVFRGSTVEVFCKDVSIEEERTKWEVQIPFQTYLTNSLKVEFSAEVLDNFCYAGTNAALNVSFEPFCVYPFRDIELIENALLLKFYPIPIENELNLEIESKKKDFVGIEIFDNLGNIVLDKVLIDVDEGMNKKKINFSYFENGIYFVNLYFKNELKQIMVIKLK
ncbi:MAG: T9SS type A sorting domain-containing protein [Candidatus Kapaibacteriota bacterium]